MGFSERMGLVEPRKAIQIGSADEDLRIALWNVIYRNFLADTNKLLTRSSGVWPYFADLWGNILKKPLDEVPGLASEFAYCMRDLIVKSPWNVVYDIVEYTCEIFSALAPAFNEALEREGSGYRVIDGLVVPISTEEEIQSIHETISAGDRWIGARIHIAAALRMLADRTNPDYRNSIKESISAVEAAVKIIVVDEKATLGKALGNLERNGELHPSLAKAFQAIYGYTSDAEGIRHSLSEKPSLEAADAKYMLITCSAFVNYLISKEAK